jgi:NAD(P)-dependent dehydrogenase (short-subunit alcohol dehydrogenase family)
MARVVLVTGTSTGIGRAIALHLAGRGFEVLAGVRKPEDAPPGLEPIVLDVTSEDDIAAAASRVGRKRRSGHAARGRGTSSAARPRRWPSSPACCRTARWTR